MGSRKLKIAVFGLGSDNISSRNIEDAYLLGQLIALRGHILVTGLANGITSHVIKGCKSNFGFNVGINPYNDELTISNDISFNGADLIINTGLGDSGRNVISVRTCDGMIVINGSFGVLNEITVGVGENKPILILRNSGGVSNIIQNVFNELKPNYKYYKIIDNVKDCLEELEKMILEKYNLEKQK
jgi:uncharacterized protein (TIGR00725 family)